MPGPWALWWVRAAVEGHQSGCHRFSAATRGSLLAGSSLGEAPSGHLLPSTPCARGGCRVGWPVTLLAAQPPCSGSLGSCRPAVLSLGKIPGPRPGSHKPLWPCVHSARSQPPRWFQFPLPCPLGTPPAGLGSVLTASRGSQRWLVLYNMECRWHEI